MRNVVRLVAAVMALGVLVTATPSSAQLFGRRNDESAVRINELEQRLRNLTGQIEQLSFQLRELQDQMRRMQEDNEYRFQQLEGGTPGNRTDLQPGLDQNGVPQPGTLTTPGGAPAVVPADGSGDGSWAQSGGYETNTDTLPSSGPIDLSALANGIENAGPERTGADLADPPIFGNDDQIASVIAGGDPRTDYDRAYSLAVNGNYGAAEREFRAFLEIYPDNELAPNAQYWLGESLLAQQNYREAADAFLKTYTEHPGSNKTPDSLLKLGVALRGLGEADAACATFSELLNNYPGAAPAVLTQARDERSRAQCS